MFNFYTKKAVAPLIFKQLYLFFDVFVLFSSTAQLFVVGDIFLIFFIFILSVVLLMIRGGAPRYRIDQLSSVTFNALLPFMLVFAFCTLLLWLLF